MFTTVRRFLASQIAPALPAKRPARERFVLPAEWLTIRPILAGCPDKVRIYFTLLFVLGCRRDELRTMRWADIDLQAGLWHKLKTKNGKRQMLPLCPETCALLAALPLSGPYVFPGETMSAPWSRTAVKYWWRKIRWASGCPDVQIRDLRRSCASWMTMNGENLKVVQTVLDHSSLSTTQIYARLDLHTVKEALARHARRILS